MTSIEWTEATWNPIAGCSVLSPGCTHCYAMRTAARLARIEATATVYAGLTQPSKAGPVWTGKIAVNEKALLEPLRRRKPTMYFVNSMSDLFHGSVPDEVIDRVFAVMALCAPRLLPNGERWEGHIFQILTKRSDRMRAYLSKHRWHLWAAIGRAIDGKRWASLVPIMGGDCTPLPNVWLGVSVEDQKRADERIPDLLATPAAVRFLSCEPLLGPVDIRHFMWPVCKSMPARFRSWDEAEAAGELTYRRQSLVAASSVFLDWVIVGGESGPGARPMHPDWARSLRDQCADAGVPFFFKQWGEFAPGEIAGEFLNPDRRAKGLEYWDGRWQECWSEVDGHCDDEPDLYPIGKKRAGRLLDGVTHDAMPQVHRHA